MTPSLGIILKIMIWLDEFIMHDYYTEKLVESKSKIQCRSGTAFKFWFADSWTHMKRTTKYNLVWCWGCGSGSCVICSSHAMARFLITAHNNLKKIGVLQSWGMRETVRYYLLFKNNGTICLKLQLANMRYADTRYGMFSADTGSLFNNCALNIADMPPMHCLATNRTDQLVKHFFLKKAQPVCDMKKSDLQSCNPLLHRAIDLDPSEQECVTLPKTHSNQTALTYRPC
ncbi:hypothetical protein DFS34DRAFT_589276 [Phlyctochytrium arcticum]|nr:hypothetical protein DFS34DRAFT_589276 [Phlyctochytrium arcticum]